MYITRIFLYSLDLKGWQYVNNRLASIVLEEKFSDLNGTAIVTAIVALSTSPY